MPTKGQRHKMVTVRETTCQGVDVGLRLWDPGPGRPIYPVVQPNGLLMVAVLPKRMRFRSKYNVILFYICKAVCSLLGCAHFMLLIDHSCEGG